MNTPNKALRKRMENQARHYNERQARAAEEGPMALVALWSEVCRKLAKDALQDGDRTVADALSSHLNDFYVRHTT